MSWRKINKYKKTDKYLDFAWELKRQLNAKVTVVPVMVEIVSKNLENNLDELKIKGKVKYSRPQHYLDWLGYLDETWRPKETCCHSDPNNKISELVWKTHKEYYYYYYNNNDTEISQNTELSPGKSRRLAVSQNPVKGH